MAKDADVRTPVWTHATFEDLKSRGNNCLAQNDTYGALKWYGTALELGSSYVEEDEEKEGVVDACASILHCNRAQCFLDLGILPMAEKECADALELDPTYSRAYIRRASIHKGLGKIELVKQDLKEALKYAGSLRLRKALLKQIQLFNKI